MVKYIHEDDVHNLRAPGAIVPVLMEMFSPSSVVDVGCGTGTFLRVFKEYGVQKITGLDGGWVNRDKLMIGNNEFIETDLEKPVDLPQKYDLVICLEVVEHLVETSADSIISSLVRLGDTIIFSAAFPGQGGQNHINEQPISYWQQKFSAHGFEYYDVLRSKLWDNKDVNWWYKQNMFLVTKKPLAPTDASLAGAGNPIQQLIHPDVYLMYKDLYQNLRTKYETITTGKGKMKMYFGLLQKKAKAMLSSK
ncbi:MAG: methyltransferase domain-containing protein [Chitinophagaceae bacterium]